MEKGKPGGSAEFPGLVALCSDFGEFARIVGFCHLSLCARFDFCFDGGFEFRDAFTQPLGNVLHK
jgi:hypothetical protein